MERRISARSFARLLGDWRPPDGRGLAGALTDQIRLLVLDGRLGLQTRVPAERELAAALQVSRTTVAAAYEALRDARVLHSRRGAGSWTQLPPELAGGGRVSPFFPLGSGPGGADGLFDLAHAALPAPSAELRRAAAAAVARPGRLPAAGTATSCSGCPRCGRPSPTGSPRAGCRPRRTRSWSPRGPCTRSRSR